jgi:hypothetical protein
MIYKTGLFPSYGIRDSITVDEGCKSSLECGALAPLGQSADKSAHSKEARVDTAVVGIAAEELSDAD